MPSRQRAADDHATLLLTTNHILTVAGSTDTPVRIDAHALSYPIDVLSGPDLSLSLSCTCDRVNIPPKVVAQSHIANHLVQYLRTNASQLGLDYVSGIIHDQDNKPKLIVRPGRLSLQVQRLSTCATLVELDLAYIWETPSQQMFTKVSPLTDPFARNLSLPYLALLDDVVERFVNRDLVKRYPLIFGPWRRVTLLFLLHGSIYHPITKSQQLEIEVPFFPTIYRSVRGIVDRSPNPAFKERCSQLFMILRENMHSVTAVSATSISNALPDYDFPDVGMPMSELDSLCLAMERLFQVGMQLPRYKGLSRGAVPDRVDDEELSQKMPQCPPDGAQESAQSVLWELHSEGLLNNSMGEPSSSSYERFLFRNYDTHLFQTGGHQNATFSDIGLGLPTGESHNVLAWDSDEELWQDEDTSSTVNDIFCPALDRVTGATDFKYNEGSFQQNGDTARLNANQGHLSQPSDLCEALMAKDDIDFRHPMGAWQTGKGDKDSGDEFVFAAEEQIQDNTEATSRSLQKCYQWAIDNLFAHDDGSGTEGGHEAVDDNDIDLLSEGSTFSLNGDLDEDMFHFLMFQVD
ncbi:hypothetical protein AX15_000047 [Amanita polypyramis BW_CC]|nr:hypothetical protein AX15_000047 [Amanita polypyramis BW_CC]